MKKYVQLILFLLINSSSWSQTQYEMNEEERNNFLKADQELNRVYQQIIKEYKDDTSFIRALKASQRIWIQFREAEMKVMYPDREAGSYGSVFPMCWSIYKTDLTVERTKKLKKWLEGEEEGNVCSGTIKFKE